MSAPGPPGRQYGQAAAAYARFRVGYPDRLIDDILSYAEPPVRSAIDLGAGTGQVTRLLAARGISVTAVDPDPAMLQELQAGVEGPVRLACSTLEDVTGVEPVDLVAAAASLHWTQPQGRWSRLAALLRPGGTFACCGGTPRLGDAAQSAAAIEAAAPYLDPQDAQPGGVRALSALDGPPGPPGMQWPGDELRNAAEFTEVAEQHHERRFTQTRDDFVGYLGTVSTFLRLPGDRRGQALEAIQRALPARVPVNADLTLHLARRGC